MFIYPAMFTKEATGYSVVFPDLEGCQTQGETLEEAYKMSEESLGLYLVSLEERNIPIPQSSDPQSLIYSDQSFMCLIASDISKYRRNKSVKKTLTIPQWLNEEAEKQHLNFSAVLQEALRQHLNL